MSRLNKIILVVCCAFLVCAFINPEDVVQIPFTGKLINRGSSLSLGNADFQDLENFWPSERDIWSRYGMEDYTSDTEPNTYEVIKVFPFDSDYDFYLIAASVSTSGTSYFQVEDQAFGSSALYADSGTTATPITYGVVRDTLAIGDGSGVTLWSGTTTAPLCILEETESGTYTNRSDWIYDGEEHTLQSGNTVHIGYSRPFDAIKPDTDDAAWDETASGTTEYLKGGFSYYWTSYLSGGSTFESPVIQTSPRGLGTHWDGLTWQFAHVALLAKSGDSPYEDSSLFIADSSPETYMDVGEWESGGTLFFVFPFRPRTIRLEFPETNKNETASSVSGYYWNGTDWSLLSNFSDGTSHGGVAFSQDGNLEFDQATDWERRAVGGVEYSGYAMYLKTSATIDNYTRIFKATAVPYYASPIDDGGYTGVLSAHNRLWLYNGTDKGRICASALNQPDVFIGADAIAHEDDFRIGKNEKVIAALAVNSESILWLKKTGNYVTSGYNPETYMQFTEELPGTVPCIAPESAIAVTRPEGSFVAYQGIDGFYALWPNGQSKKISSDIDHYFEKDHEKEIPAAWLDETIGAYDPVNSCLRWLVASGSGSTTYNKELVYMLDRDRWTTFTRNGNKELRSISYIRDDSNNRLMLAGGYAGEVWQLDSGTDDDGYDIISVFDRGFRNFGIERQEIRNIAFQYELPDESSLTGVSLYVTPSISKNATTYQTSLTLRGDGYVVATPSGADPGRIGFAHKIKLRIPGRVYMRNQLIEVRRAQGYAKNNYGNNILAQNGDIIIQQNGYSMLY